MCQRLTDAAICGNLVRIGLQSRQVEHVDCL